jgi:hypothetical protein
MPLDLALEPSAAYHLAYHADRPRQVICPGTIALNPSTSPAGNPDPHAPASPRIAALWRAFTASRYGWILLGCSILLLLGIIFLQDYGTSIDEWHNSYYGQLFLHIYEGGSLLQSPDIDYFNGPFYFMLFTVTARLFRFLHPAWLATDGLHLTNFITFLIGILFFYRLCLRLLPRTPALLTSALFASQPLLFGHAFINQKDTPFMVYFLASVELGLTAFDHLFQHHPSDPPPPSTKAEPGSPWRTRPARFRTLWLAAAALLTLVTFDLWISTLSRSAADALVTAAYHRQALPLINRLFARFATDAYKTPLPLYFDKVHAAFFWLRLALTPLLAAAALALWKIGFPSHFARYPLRWLRRWGPLLLAGCVLGLTTSIRILGPFAGALVALVALALYRRRTLPTLAAYAAIAMLTTFLTWPVLWGNPVASFINLLAETSTFTEHAVFFLGRGLDATSLPVIYLPLLLAIQLTLPALALAFVGLPASWAMARRNPRHLWLILLLWLWFLLPALAVMTGLIPVYNNFRHVLFILPPLLLIAGIGLAWLLRRLRLALARLALAALLLAPGIVGILQLHPYEYIYYNQLVGGVAGAEGRFELDYWCTAFRPAMEYVDAVAPDHASVTFYGGYLSAAPYARADLALHEVPVGIHADFSLADLACLRYDYHRMLQSNQAIVYEVRRQGALLAIVKHRQAVP